MPQGRSATLLVWRTDQVKPAPTTWNVLYGGGSAYRGRITTFESPLTIADAAHVLKTTRPDLRPYSAEMLGGRPDQVPERYFERSPINFVQNIKGQLVYYSR